MISRRKYFIGGCVVILLAGLGLWYYQFKLQKKKDEVFVEVKSIHSPLGWGYDIVVDGKVYIHQQFIPGLPGKHGFKNEEDAQLVGKKVVSRLSANQLPTITLNDLRGMGIVKDSVPE